MNRRFFIGAASAAIVLGSGGAALALNENEARSLIDKVVADINRIISSGQSEAQMLRQFEGVFERYSDPMVIGQLVLGPDGRAASAAQKSAFAKAFQGYMSRKYGRRFREFIGGRIVVDGSRKVKSFFEVTTTAHLAGTAPFVVEFVVAEQTGRFIDLRIEGISLVKAERAEIGAMLDKRRGDLDRLITDLAKLG
jgi:phospholipid transport system substrate-binding protein